MKALYKYGSSDAGLNMSVIHVLKQAADHAYRVPPYDGFFFFYNIRVVSSGGGV